MFEGKQLAPVTTQFNIIELRAIEAESLELALGSKMGAAERALLKREAGNFLTMARLQELGIIATYDPARLTLNLALAPEKLVADIVQSVDDRRDASAVRGLGDDPRLTRDLLGSVRIERGSGEGSLPFGHLADFAGRLQPIFALRRQIESRDRTDTSQVETDASTASTTQAKAEPKVPEVPEVTAPVPAVPPAPAVPAAAATSSSSGMAGEAAPVVATPDQQTPQASRITIYPLLEGNRLGLVTAELTITELRAIEAGSLERALGDRLAAAPRTALKRETGSFLPVARLKELGISATYDPANLTITLALAPEAVGPQTFTFTGNVDLGAAERVLPADLAFGVTGNLIGSHDFSDPQSDTRLLYNFAGFLNIGGRERGGYLLFGGLVDFAERAPRRFVRDRLVAFKDFEGPTVRVAAGDLVAGLPLIAGEADVAGISIERRYDALQPLRNIRPTGRRQFVLERPARIEIYANGALVQALEVNAGPVDLNRIPALSLSTNIAIIVEDATGRREIDSFTLANDIELLAAGLSEFNVTAGVMRKPSANGFAYSATPLLTGQFARGFSDVVTAGGHFALMDHYQNFGLTFASLAPGGALFLGGSASHDRTTSDLGYAVSLAYRGDPLRLSDLDSQLNFRLDWRSASYRRLSQTILRDPVKLDIALDYRLNLTERVAVSLGGNYLENHTQGPATRAVFGGVQVAMGRLLASATARYADIGGRTDKGLLATLTIPLGRNHFSTASYDSVTRQARFEARRLRDITVPEFDYGIVAEHSPLFDRLTGQARFANSRFNLDVEMVGTRGAADGGTRDQNAVNFRLQSGFAFADGQLGIGRNPGRGFVMIDRHASLKDARVEVETSGVGRRAGQSNGLGPAVISQLSGYRPDNIRVSVLGAPPGYDIGPGEYLSDPGALSGVKVTVGSDAYRSALVTFVMPDGSPVKLTDGLVRNLATGETSGVFTNASGRAVLSKLVEGQYRVELRGGDLLFELTVDKSAPAIIRLGTQTMEVAP
ncbi:fimbria/pilus outer membrane usher protein [Porphyrobacter sp. HT-58-2]|uniref:fimbria/pilus outer membrane usher protein n=1 Tax=Porphyrobacter sp. HT-58-2 TaxID=2023229 RepID=UPI001558FE51|nr:fimbria/pilus outer membrane usher protein [Porphyrobacter sp. HT-58-2]